MFADYQPRASGESTKSIPANMSIHHTSDPDRCAIASLIAQRENLSDDQALDHASSTLSKPPETNLILVAQIQTDVIAFTKAAYTSFDPPEPHVPRGWYLTGIIVDPQHRRRGIGAALTESRLQWISERAREVFYFANSLNRVSIELHQHFGFQEICRDFKYPGATFSGGGGGVLFRLSLD